MVSLPCRNKNLPLRTVNYINNNISVHILALHRRVVKFEDLKVGGGADEFISFLANF